MSANVMMIKEKDMQQERSEVIRTVNLTKQWMQAEKKALIEIN